MRELNPILHIDSVICITLTLHKLFVLGIGFEPILTTLKGWWLNQFAQPNMQTILSSQTTDSLKL